MQEVDVPRLQYDDDGKPLVGGVPMFIVQGGTDYRCRARFMDICFYK
jgi:hypothetical protein